MTKCLSASLSIFGDVDQVTAELVESEANPGDHFVSIRVGRLHVSFDLTTAVKLRGALGEAIARVEP